MRFYLNFAEQVSQIWLDKYVIVLVLLIVKVILFKNALLTGLSACQAQAEQMCQSMDRLLKQADQVPEAITQLTNYVIEQFINNLLGQLRMLIHLALAILKGLIGFIIEVYLGTFTCLCTAFVKGALDIVTDATRTITEAVELVVNEFLKGFNSALDGLSTVVNGFVTTLKSIKSFFTDTDTSDISSAVDTVNLTASTIKNISIPTTFIDDLSALSNKIPDYEDVLSNLTSVVTKPLDVLKKEVDSMTSSNATLNLNEIKSYQKSASGNTCDSLDADFQKLEKSINATCSWILLALGMSILLLVMILAFFMYRSYRRRRSHIEELTLENSPERIGNVLEVQRNKLGLFIMNLNLNYRVKWLLNYISSSTATNCLLVGLAGLLVVGLQYWLLSITSNKLNHFFTQDNAALQNSTAQRSFEGYISDTQFALDNLLESLNEALFGSIDSTSERLYENLLEAENSINDTINSVFGGTPFASPLQTIVYCTIGRKLEKIEDGLQWINENLKIEYPSLPEEDMLRLMTNTLHDTTDADGGIGSAIKSSSDKFIKSYKKSLFIELIVSCVFLGVWLLLFVVGLLILAIRELMDKLVLPKVISMPQPLSSKSKSEYEYPVSDPFVRAASSVYTETHIK